MLKLGLMFAVATLTSCLLTVSPGQAATRAWVSGHGTDMAGCGAPTAPCRSLQYAHDNIVAAGGEIDILDPAGYGAVTITKAISIINDGVGTAGVQAASGEAIVINAGANDAVVLRGLDIQGAGGDSGIFLITAASLSVLDCTVKGFTFAGIQYNPTSASYLYVSNTRLMNNGVVGVNVVPFVTAAGATVQAALERVEAVNDDYGIFFDGRQSAQSVTVNGVLSDSMISNNAQVGVESISTASNATTFAIMRNSTVANGGTGADAEGTAVLYVAHSTLSGLAKAFNTSAGVIGSYKDNNVDGNVIEGDIPTLAPFH